MATPVTTQGKVNREDRRDKVMALARGGASERQIAKALGCAKTTVHKDIEARLRESAASHEDTQVVRRMTVERLEDLMRSWYAKAKAGDPVAMGHVMKLVDRIAAFNGVAPVAVQKIEHSGQVETGDSPHRVEIEFVQPAEQTRK